MACACAWINEQKNEMFRLLAFGEARLGGYTGFLETGIIKQGENHPPPSKKLPRVVNKMSCYMF